MKQGKDTTYDSDGITLSVVKTILSESIDIAEMCKRYDEKCKLLLSDKTIIARILKSVIISYSGEKIDDIANNCIEMNTENVVPNEGKRQFDILFATALRDKIIVNIEAQSDYYPGYRLETRAIYHLSRMISSQYGKEFEHSQFDNIKKVYSIWICTNPSLKDMNTIARYVVRKEDVRGEQTDNKIAYDKIEIIKICVGNEYADNYSGIIKLLHILLVSKMSMAEKKSILQREYGMKLTESVEREVVDVCTLSYGVLAQGVRQGLEQGVRQGLEQGLAEGRAKGLAEGRAKGLAEGRAKGRAEVLAVIKKYISGASAEDIAEEMGYALDDVVEIINDYEK